MPLKYVHTDMPFTVMSTEADMDYILARMVNFCGGLFSARAGFLGQMACEKYLKALMIQNDRNYINNSHNLLELAKTCGKYDQYFVSNKTNKTLEIFDMFTEIGRYGATSKYDPISKGKSVGDFSVSIGTGIETRGTFFWSSNYLGYLDEFVFKIRSMLDHSKIDQEDVINSILMNKKDSVFIELWNFPIAIRDVLTHENSFYR